MTKKRILMCGESHNINSGFGRYTKEVLTRLYNTNKYEIAEFASYLFDGQDSNVPWRVYPNAVKDDSELSETYKSNIINQFGKWRFDKVVLDFKPDIVFDIRDYWMFSYQELSPLRKYFHWVIAPTIDSIPQKTEWLSTFENADLVATHTDWAADYLRSLNRRINIGPCVTDSVDHNEFRPINFSKNYHKVKYGIPQDSIVIGSVMRNQKRKLIAELFDSLRKLIEITNNDRIFLYLHTSFPEAQGWDIPELLQTYGVYNNVLFTYYAPTAKSICVSPYKGPKIIFPDDPSTHAIFPSVINGVSNKQLTEIYNLFDIYVQYAICEGLGIPQLEAASCGIPIFAVNYSGMEEITTKVDGVKIKHILSKELETGSDRATPDNNHLVQEIIKWINTSKDYKRKLSKNTRDLLVKHYSWDKTSVVWEQIFDSLEPKNLWHEPMDTNHSISIPDNLSNREFINFIIVNILKEPKLLKTFFIQSLIKALDEQYELVDRGIKTSSRKEIVSSLEAYLNNKIYYESIRSGSSKLTDKFLER
jgi:glycosyltransferase involved in cell wall biosynthesis